MCDGYGERGRSIISPTCRTVPHVDPLPCSSNRGVGEDRVVCKPLTATADFMSELVVYPVSEIVISGAEVITTSRTDRELKVL